jgi:hypothetical protein
VVYRISRDNGNGRRQKRPAFPRFERSLANGFTLTRSGKLDKKNRRASSPVLKGGFYAHEERKRDETKIGEHPPLFSRGVLRARGAEKRRKKLASISPVLKGKLA